ncbi:amidohydrolase family protein [Streptomyces cylindrosporus]|uniref:Amidohydrolase n=1 Tax=Streptomyces cylindrosporus TaxID=2927583 RepID=A0ABS9YA40_9ACTN|nr:amidohydrolase family protein [Streptomyces cylindrosporus]MCI3273385.1 amidohydrolase [Streptomyces cylindrosporus]
MRIIDTHTHVVPSGLAAPDHDERWPVVVERDDGSADVLIAGRVFRTVPRTAYDLEHRAEQLAPDHVQVLSPMPELFSYWGRPQAGADYCTSVNEWIAAGVNKFRHAFRGFGIAAMQDPDVACGQLSQIAALGLPGVEIGSNIAGVLLHDKRYIEFFDEASRLGLVVFIHAFHPPGIGTFTDPMAGNGVTFPNEIGQAVGGLIAEGMLERFSDLKILASHGGGSFVSLLPRLQFIARNYERARVLMPRDPADYARKIFYDMLVFSAPLLSLLLDNVGAGRVVVGSDKPFMNHDPVTLLERFPHLGSATIESIRWGNAARLLGL